MEEEEDVKMRIEVDVMMVVMVATVVAAVVLAEVGVHVLEVAHAEEVNLLTEEGEMEGEGEGEQTRVHNELKVYYNFTIVTEFVALFCIIDIRTCIRTCKLNGSSL